MKQISITLLAVFLFIGCEHDLVEPDLVPPDVEDLNACDSTKVYFRNDILPIFISSCAFSGCHDAGTGMSGVVFSSYENIIKSKIVVAGDTARSKIYQRITATDPNDRMPYGGSRLPQEHIDKIRQWILDGAENSYCNESHNCDTNQVSYSGIISKIVQQKCNGCHRGGNPGGRIDLTTYRGVQEIALDKRFLNAVLHAPGFKAMPLGGEKLPDCEIEAIRMWINDGAPNN